MRVHRAIVQEEEAIRPIQLTLLVTRGEAVGNSYYFDRRGRCIIGRADDCDVILGRHELGLDVSRHHCELEFDPPTLWLRDLGSRNGTFLNEKCLGHRQSGTAVEKVDLRQFPAFSLNHGDQIRVGETVFYVGVCGVEAAAPVYLATIFEF